MQMYLILIYLKLAKLQNTAEFHLTFKAKRLQSQKKHTLHNTYNRLIIIYGSGFVPLQQMVIQTKISKSKLV